MIAPADRDRIFAVMLIPLVVYALFALVSPTIAVRGFGRPRRRAPIREAILRVAGVLVLIGAAIMWWRVWGP
jgi:hypothetical protein